uniref:Lipase maturation factor n=1 Tax=Sexangularia sp. CB-2014 TaxID=1486929 RepID=A0A7S1VBT1_9EUKA
MSRVNSYIFATHAFLSVLGFVHTFQWLTFLHQSRALFSTSHSLFPPPTTTPPLRFDHHPAFLNQPYTPRTLDFIMMSAATIGAILATTTTQHALLLCLAYAAQITMLNLPLPGVQTLIKSFGWHWQTASTTLLGIAVAPWFSRRLVAEPPVVGVWLLRALSFLVMWGAGMSKLGANASDCWRYPHFSCTTTHYETQPFPSVVAFFLHRLPFTAHQAEVVYNHIVELVLPYGLLLPVGSNLRGLCGLGTLAYMGGIIASGSYAQINWITVAPVLFAMDDAFFAHFLPSSLLAWRDDLVATSSHTPGFPLLAGQWLRTLLIALFAIFFAYKSVDPIKESLGPSPWLHYYDPWYVSNAYGVFGFVNAKRFVTTMSWQTDEDKEHEWHEAVYRALPSSTDRMQYCAPYHYLFDWRVWIETTASLESRRDKSRFVPRVLAQAAQRVMAGDVLIADLFHNGHEMLPPGGAAPVRFRFDLWQYHFTSIDEWRATGVWWTREAVPTVRPLIVERQQAVATVSPTVQATHRRRVHLMQLASALVFAVAAAVATDAWLPAVAHVAVAVGAFVGYPAAVPYGTIVGLALSAQAGLSPSLGSFMRLLTAANVVRVAVRLAPAA